MAISRLNTVNASELIGFIVFLDYIPKDEYKELLRKFLYKCNIICSNKSLPLVVCVRELTGFSKLLPDDNNLNIHIVSGYEFITDTIIKRDIFGTILKETRDPISIKDNSNNDIDRVINRLSFNKILPNVILNCFKKVVFYDSLEDTLSKDLILYSLKDNYLLNCLREIRINFIHSRFNKSFEFTTNIYELDNKGFCICKSLERFLNKEDIECKDIERGEEVVATY